MPIAKEIRIVVLALVIAAAWPLSACAARSGPLPLRTVADIPLPGDASRFDYQSYDPQRHLLFIAHLGDSTVIVFDTQTQRIVANIPDIGHVHGVLAIPELGRAYASATKTDEVVAIDENALAVTARIPGGAYPDGMAYASDVHKLYVSDETGATETVIDVASNRRVATLPLGGEAGNTQYDPVSRHVFVNVQTRAELVEIDPRTDRVVARHPLPGADGNHGLLIEPTQRMAYIGCEDNDKLLTVDMKTMRVVQSFSVGRTPDVLAFDPGPHLLYVASEAGVVSVFDARGGRLRKIAQGRLAAGAHSVAVDPATHRAYFPLKNVAGRPVLRIAEPETGLLSGSAR